MKMTASTDEVAAEVLLKTTQLLKGRSTKEELEKLYQETIGKESPKTTASWLKEAIVRTIQKKHYEEKGVPVPDRVKKNDLAFFSAPVPHSNPEEEKKETSMKKAKSDVEEKKEAPVAERKNKSGATLVVLNKDAQIDELIKKQKTEHVKVLMTLIKDAGAKGITIDGLATETPKALKDKTTWEKYKPPVHINYVLKKLKGLVTITAPVA
jgi:DNA integrity scanning protein DisA with diadenylate cyclase activity